ncbi:peptide chain release factor N(5)-glutamine methyltransferase [Alphaproteobacteria bacterium LSUCC0684]
MTAPAEAASVAASEVLKNVSSRLASGRPEGAIDSPVRDARLLLALALGREDAVLPHETITMTAEAEARLEACVGRRLSGEPLSRLRGWREFYSLRFGLSPATLDPRPDSECLVDQALAWFGAHPVPAPKVLDFGTGSGCLLLAVLNAIPDAHGTGVDLAPEAVDQAALNARGLGLDDRARFLTSDWDKELAGKFLIILANPPYIPTGDLAGLMPEVRDHDPELALDGGRDGGDCWRRLLPAIARKLEKDGRAFVEIGAGQEEMVASLAGESGLVHVGQARDLGGIIRCLEFELP